MISFPVNLPGVESETRIVSELYIDFIVKHHVNHFRCQSSSTLSMVRSQRITFSADLAHSQKFFTCKIFYDAYKFAGPWLSDTGFCRIFAKLARSVGG